MVGLHPDLLKPHGITRNSLAGFIPVSGQMITHSTVREERGIPRSRPIIDDAAPAYYATTHAPPFLCIVGDQDLPARAEENRYFVAAMKAAGHERISYAEFAGRVRVMKLNVDDNPATAARFNARSIPTLLVLDRGHEVDRIVGVRPKAEIINRLDAVLRR